MRRARESRVGGKCKGHSKKPARSSAILNSLLIPYGERFAANVAAFDSRSVEEERETARATVLCGLSRRVPRLSISGTYHLKAVTGRFRTLDIFRDEADGDKFGHATKGDAVALSIDHMSE